MGPFRPMQAEIRVVTTRHHTLQSPLSSDWKALFDYRAAYGSANDGYELLYD